MGLRCVVTVFVGDLERDAVLLEGFVIECHRPPAGIVET
jgi:hypothetical protein